MCINAIKEQVMKKVSLFILILSSLFFISCGGGGSSSTTQSSSACISEVDGLCIIATTENSTDDALLRAIHTDTMNFYEFNTDFFLYKEASANRANAFANQNDQIFFGNYLLQALKKESPENYPTMIKVILADEYGHIVQFHTFVNTATLAPQRQSINVGSTVVLSELEADAFSGLYMYFELKDEKQIDLYFELLDEIGSTDFTSEDFHGTGVQRQAAAAYGILTANYIIENNLVDYINWADIRVEFLRGIATYILQDVNYRQSQTKHPFGFSEENLDIVRGIAAGTNTINDLNL
jgi:hypothetical protein